MAENYGTLEGTLDEHGVLSGEMNDRATLEGEIQFSNGGGGVLDVFQNGQSVVEGRKAYVTVPTLLRELRSDDSHNTVTTLEIQNWNGKADPDDIPTALSQLDNDDNYVQDADYVHTDNNFTDEDKAAIGNIPENITDLSDVEVSNIQNGQVLKWDSNQNKFVNANESGGGSGDVADVKVNGTSVVDPVTKEANIDLTGYAETSDIPTDLADLSDDATHRLVTDTEKSTWDNKADVSDIPTVNNPTITIQKNGQNVDSFTLNQDSNEVINIAVPTKTSDLQNDNSFITNTVNNLANYYLKSDTYTQTEVNNLISAAVNGRFEKVTTLPASGEPNVIYLVPKTTALTNNVYDEYIWQDNAWELLGSTEIDLSNYVTTTDLATALADYVTTSAFNTAIANYYTKTEVGNLLDGKVDKVSGKGLSTYDYDATAKGIVDSVTTNLAGKVDKVNGKGLSTEDYTTTEKNKLAGISTGANKVESSTTNGNIKIDGTETQVYDGSGKVDKVNGKGLSTNDFTNEDKALIGKTLGNNTVLTTDKTTFLTRQTLNPTGFSGYVREKLVGASYAWNQLVQNGNFADTSVWTRFGTPTFTVSGNVATLSVSSGSCARANIGLSQDITNRVNKGRKYFVTGEIKSDVSTNFTVRMRGTTNGSAQVTPTANTWTKINLICSVASDSTTVNFYFDVYNETAFNSALTLQVKNCQISDLTLAFGSTIADYLYSLTNNGGITKLRNMGFPIDKYTPYGYGLYSVKTSEKKIYGYNLLGNTPYGGGYYNAPIGTDLKNTSNVISYTRTNDEIVVDITGAWYGHTFATPVLPVGHYKFAANFSSLTSGVLVRATLYITTEDYIVKAIDYNFQYNGYNYRQDIELTEPSRLVLWIGANNPTKITAYHPIIAIKNLSRDYEGYTETTYPLGNDELRGMFKLVNNEIVASGDVKESNGGITRVRGSVHLGDVTFSYNSTYGIFTYALPNGKTWVINTMPTLLIGTGRFELVGTRALAGFADKQYSIIAATASVGFKDSGYTDPTLFKNSLNGVYLEYELATPTTEQSTPFADPMSMVGATTEEYIDTRDIPCPVGAERQYMGQSEDVIEIPSSPLSDGKRKLVAETSGGKTQYYFEDDKNGAGTQVNLMTYNTSTNKYVCPSDGYISLSNAGASVGDYVIMSVYGANDNLICGLRCDTSVASIVTVQNLFVKRGMKCYVRATSSTGSFTALFTPLS